MTKRTSRVIVASTRAAMGVYPDQSGLFLVNWLRGKGFITEDATIIADADLEEELKKLFIDPTKLPSVILVSGGTGMSPDDRTVELLSPYLEREIPGIAHAFWEQGLKTLPTAILSRVLAGSTGNTFIMAVPGSLAAAKDAASILNPIIEHLVASLEGTHEH